MNKLFSLVLSGLLLLSGGLAQAATYGQHIEFGPYFVSGSLAAGAKVYHYAAGTGTLKNCWSDRAKTTTVAQPLVADSQGIASAFCDGVYQFVVKSSAEVTLYTFDNVAVADQTQTTTGEGAALASASTLILGTDGDFFHVTGTNTISALSGTQTQVTLAFDSALTLTHSATLILKGSASYTVAANDVFGFVNDGSGVWREIFRSVHITNPLIGTASPYAGLTLPTDHLWSDGSAVSRTTYATLFAKLVQSTTVTASASADTITWNAHGLANYMPVSLTNAGGALPSGITSGAIYWIRDATTNDFKLSATPGSSAIDLTTDGTGTTTAVVAPWGAGDGSTTFNLPASMGRTLVGYGANTMAESVAAASVDTSADTITVLANNTKWITGMAAVLTTSGTAPTGLTAGVTYYVVRNSTTTVKFASSLANAQNTTVIDLTGQGTGTHTLTVTLTTRGLGELGGEEAHAMNSAEMLAHKHTGGVGAGSVGGTSAATLSLNVDTGVTGGNLPMNIMPPFMGMRYIIRYQ